MKTKLVEFLNAEKQNLRGVIVSGDIVNGGVICLSGFEKCATTEKKFKALADKLAENMFASLRFDFSGCGLSGGDFSQMKIDSQVEEFMKALDYFKKEMGDVKINIVAHSLGACVLAGQIEKIKDGMGKIVFV